MTNLLPGRTLGLASAACAMLFVVAGCGEKALPRRATAAVHGKVTLADGKPLDAGAVLFEPENIEVGTPCEAKLQKDGTFVANAYPGQEGLAPGEYRVAIVQHDVARHGKYAGTPPAVPAKYLDPKTSEVKLTVVKDQDNTLDFQLK